LEAFPQVCDTDLIITHVREPQQGVVSLAVNLDHGLLDEAGVLSHKIAVFASLKFDTGGELLVHLLSGDAHEVGVELESEAGLEGNVDLLLGLGVDDALVVVELEALIENLLLHGEVFFVLALL